jgi:hypothetical protein
MKKVILMAAASLAFIATSFAQNGAPAKQKMVKNKPAMEAPAQGTPAPAQGEPVQMENGKGKGQGEARGKSEGRAQNGMNALGLTPEQETKFKAINQAHKTAVKAVQMNESLATEAKKAQVAELITKYQSDVQGVLNADQFAKWTAMREKRNDKGNDKGDHKGGDHKGKAGHAKMGDVKTDEQGNREGTEGYNPAPDPNAPQTPVDPNKKRKAKTPSGGIKQN